MNVMHRAVAALVNEPAACAAVGAWMLGKTRDLASKVGTQQAARNLRKQGVPLNVALTILAPRR